MVRLVERPGARRHRRSGGVRGPRRRLRLSGRRTLAKLKSSSSSQCRGPHHALSPGRTVVTSTPTTVLRDGVVDAVAMRAQRLTTAELRQAVRSSGVGGFDQVARVVLETDGTLSVIPAGRVGDGKALERDER